MRNLGNPRVGLVIAFLGAVGLGLTGYSYWLHGRLDPIMAAPTALLLALLVAYPFVVGRAPTGRPLRNGFVACASCSTLWSPAEDRMAFCPGCGKVPKSIALAPAHPYAAPMRR